MLFTALGTSLLWFGWFGFNCGSYADMASPNASEIIGRVAMNTAIAPSVACIASVYLSKVFWGKYDILIGLNAVLAGAVSITAGCAVVQPWAAMCIGLIGGLLFMASSLYLKKLEIDDPLDVTSVHLICGIWGTLAVGIFGEDALCALTYDVPEIEAIKDGSQLWVQFVGGMVIFLWSAGSSIILFYTMDFAFGLRVSKKFENTGIDLSTHGLRAQNQHREGWIELEQSLPKELISLIQSVSKADKHGRLDGILRKRTKGMVGWTLDKVLDSAGGDRVGDDLSDLESGTRTTKSKTQLHVNSDSTSIPISEETKSSMNRNVGGNVLDEDIAAIYDASLSDFDRLELKKMLQNRKFSSALDLRSKGLGLNEAEKIGLVGLGAEMLRLSQTTVNEKIGL
eukprot:g390.t1